MTKVLILLLSMGVPAFAATYTIKSGSSASSIQAIANQAGAAPGNTVMFSAGVYNLSTSVYLPCLNGTVYTGPVVGQQTITYNSAGAMTIGNRPTAIFTVSANNYVFSIGNNGASFTSPTQGCTIQYLGFNGTQGGIYVNYPSSGITVQYNAFYNNNPAWNNASPASNAAIYLDGQNGGNTSSVGVSYISILWNTFFNNCASIQANAWPDAGGDCNAVHVQSYSNYLTINNNVINQSEEGFKFYEQSYQYAVEFNTDVENNNMQGNSRILIEDQQPTNANAVFSHNAFYEPTNPSYNTFELSLPLNQCVSTAGGCSGDGSGAATVTNDNVYIGNVPVTIIGSGAHYGIGLEQWGVGATSKYNLYQGGNGPDTCAGGFGCSGWGTVVGLAITNADDTNNYYSGYDAYQGGPIGFEAGATASNAGMVLTPNTVVATSTTIPTVAPTISTSSASGARVVTIHDSDSNHGLTIFYTTDGTTPAIFGPGGSAGTSQVYMKPFTVAAGATVKTIASWGQGANQGIVFPSFGYVPSAVVTAAVSAPSTTAGHTLVSAYLGSTGNANTMSTGKTLQFTAYGVYSDGSIGALPDAQGNTVTTWSTTNHKVAIISMHGHVTAMGAGTVSVKAMVGPVVAAPWGVTVTSAAQPPSQPGAIAAAAEIQATPSAKAQMAAAADIETPPAADSQGLPAAAPAAAPTAAPAAAPTVAPSAVPATNGGSGVPASGPIPAGPGPAQADEFIGPFWRLVTASGGSASISNSHLFLGVPGGANHDPLIGTNQAVRVEQAIGNENFDVAIKIDSPLFASDASTSQGLMVLSDDTNFITFALTTDGTKVGLSAHTVTGGAASEVLEDSDFSQYQNPIYLRLTKSASAYVALYSVDGVNWTQAVSFTYSGATTSIGPFASNYNSTPANAVPVVMSVNWFDVQQ